MSLLILSYFQRTLTFCHIDMDRLTGYICACEQMKCVQEGHTKTYTDLKTRLQHALFHKNTQVFNIC